MLNSATFGLLHSVTVDDQVDAQPLVLTNEAVNRWGIFYYLSPKLILGINFEGHAPRAHRDSGVSKCYTATTLENQGLAAKRNATDHPPIAF